MKPASRNDVMFWAVVLACLLIFTGLLMMRRLEVIEAKIDNTNALLVELAKAKIVENQMRISEINAQIEANYAEIDRIDAEIDEINDQIETDHILGEDEVISDVMNGDMVEPYITHLGPSH